MEKRSNGKINLISQEKTTTHPAPISSQHHLAFADIIKEWIVKYAINCVEMQGKTWSRPSSSEQKVHVMN
jgi:hypothetical protein